MAKNKQARNFVIAVAVVCCAACAPTFPRERLESALREECLKKAQTAVQVEYREKNLFVFFSVPVLFDQNSDIAPAALQILDNVAQCVTRAVLSTDAEIDFFTITVSDSGTGTLSALEITMTRYVPDLLKVINNFISREEYRDRVSWRIDANRLWFGAGDAVQRRPYTVPVFLAQQIERRANVFFEQASRLDLTARGTYDEQQAALLFVCAYADRDVFSGSIAPVLAHIAALVLDGYKPTGIEQVIIRNEITRQELVVRQDEFSRYKDINPKKLLE